MGLAATNPVAAAKIAGLRYVTDRMAGIRRIGVGKSFRYFGPNDRAIRDPSTLMRIRSLAIPPAWTEVWICPIEEGHLQAVGRDARHRKQYRYHSRWCSVRDETKFDRMADFGKVLPKIRALRAMIDASGRDIWLAVDGGVNPETAESAVAAGARVLVAGSAVFGRDHYADAIRSLRANGQRGLPGSV